MTFLNIPASPDPVTTSNGSTAEVIARCCWAGVACILKRQPGTKFILCNGYHTCSSPIMSGKTFCAIFTDVSRGFRHDIDCGQSDNILPSPQHTYHGCCHQVKWFPKGHVISSAKNISVRAEWLRQSGRAPSEPSETPRWRITPHPASIPHVTLHIALRSQFCRFFLRLCKSILRCSWKNLQLWRCIQDATRFDY